MAQCVGTGALVFALCAFFLYQELGFKRGVRKTTQGFVHGRVDTSKKLTEFVECLGSETSIHDCRVTFSANSHQNCKLTEVIRFALS